MSKLTQRFGYERVMNSSSENMMFGGPGMGMMGQSGPACYNSTNNHNNAPLANQPTQFHNNDPISSSMYPNFNNSSYNNNMNTNPLLGNQPDESINSEAKRQRLENNIIIPINKTTTPISTDNMPIPFIETNNQLTPYLANPNLMLRNINMNQAMLQGPSTFPTFPNPASANALKENMLIRIMSSNSLSNLTMTRTSSFNDLKFDTFSDFDYSIGLGEKLFGSSGSLVGLAEQAEAIVNANTMNNNTNVASSSSSSTKNGINITNGHSSNQTKDIDFNSLKTNNNTINYPVRHLGDEDGSLGIANSQPSNTALIGMRSLCMSNNEAACNEIGMKKSKSYETMGSSSHSSSNSTAPMSSDEENNRHCLLTEKDDFEFLRLLGHC